MVKNLGISAKDRKILWAKAGNRCSYRFNGNICYKELIKTQVNKNTVTAEEAHIVGPKKGSPRYIENFHKIDSYENRILLCEDCHKIIDDNEDIYSIEVVRNMKKEHEDEIAKRILIPIPKEEPNNNSLKEKFRKLYKILFKTEHSIINRAELITLIDNEIGQDYIAKILKLRYKKEYSDSAGEVISLFNEKWRLNCQTGLEAGNKLNALNIYNAEKKSFHYGRENQDKTILENFRTYFFDECLKSGIVLDELYYINRRIKIAEESKIKNDEKMQGRRTAFRRIE